MTKEAVIKNNDAVVAERGDRGGLDYRMRSFVVAVDIDDPTLVMLGGLGSLGIGQMWVRGSYSEHPNFHHAPRVTGGMAIMDLTSLQTKESNK